MAKIISDPGNEIIAGLERKRKRLKIILACSIGVPVLFLAALIASIIIDFSSAATYEPRVKEAGWKVRELSDSGGLSIETPFPLATQTDAHYEDYDGNTKLYSYSYYNSYQFNLAISYYQEGGSLPNLDDEVKREIDHLSSADGLQYFSADIDTVYYKDIPGRKISGVYVLEHSGSKYIMSVHVKDENLWILQCFFLGNDKNTMIAERIIDSFKIGNN